MAAAAGFLAGFPFFLGVSFFPADLEGVSLTIFSTAFSTDFFPAAFLAFAADLEAALAAAFPPLALGTLATSVALAAAPCSLIYISFRETTAVVPSVKLK